MNVSDIYFTLMVIIKYRYRYSLLCQLLNISINTFPNNFVLSYLQIGQSRAALLPFKGSTKNQDLSQCSADPCTTNRCTNNGQCLYESDSSYSCLCPVGFTGKDCSMRKWWHSVIKWAHLIIFSISVIMNCQ